MSLFSSLLFAVSASLDALLVGISCGIRKVRIPFLHNLLVSLVTFIGTVLAICTGRWLIPLLADFPSAVQKISWGGSALLLGMGLYYLVKALISRLQKIQSNAPDETEVVSAAVSEPPAPALEADIASDTVSTIPADNTCDTSLLSIRELLLMGVALSANNMGIGIGASIAGIALKSASLLTFVCSVCFLHTGNLLGQMQFSEFADHYADLLSGLLLILLGIFQLIR